MLIYRRILFSVFVFLVPLCSAFGTGFILPASLTAVSDDGTVQLAWDAGDDDSIYEVRRSGSAGFESSVLVYEGRDAATFVSGLPEGEYHFKVRSKGAGGEYPDWPADSFILKVEYIDSRLVVVLMAAGFVTFLAIVGTIIMGHRRARLGV